MKKGTKINDHMNVFNTLICQLSSVNLKIDKEEKSFMLLCFLLESWDHLVTSISFSTTSSLHYGFVVGTLLYEEVQRKYSVETSTPAAMVTRG